MRDKELSPPEFEALLSRYFDGEATPEEAVLVEARLVEDPGAAELLEKFSQTRAMVRNEFHAEVSRVDFSDFWSGVEAGIERIDQSRKAAPAVAPRPAPPAPGLFERLKGWLEGFGWQPGLGLAAAAAVLLAVGLSQTLQKEEGPVAVKEPGSSARPATQPAALPAAVTQPAPPQPEPAKDQVVALDYEVKTEGIEVSTLSGGAASTVMVIKSPEQATIIWVNEAEGQGGSSI